MGNESRNRMSPTASRRTMMLEVVPQCISRHVRGRSKNVSMSLARIPRVNRFIALGNTVGPTNPGAPGSSEMAAAYAPSMPWGTDTSSSRNSMYSPAPASIPTFRDSGAPRPFSLTMRRPGLPPYSKSLDTRSALSDTT